MKVSGTGDALSWTTAMKTIETFPETFSFIGMSAGNSK